VPIREGENGGEQGDCEAIADADASVHRSVSWCDKQSTWSQMTLCY
jgi:hypothetical protein